MPKPGYRVKTPKLDMNPMVDLAFLLVTFFMLTTTFKTEEPVEVNTPSSVSEIKLPDKDIITITVDEKGRIFFSSDGKHHKEMLIELIATRHDIKISQEQINRFSLLNSFGVPIKEMPRFLEQKTNKIQDYEQTGIPCDSVLNELSDWLVFARIVNPRYRVAVKGDVNTQFINIKHVINTLLENNVLRFNLITDLEKEV